MSLFSKKAKAFFVEKNDRAWLLARCSSMAASLVVDEIVEIPDGDAAALKQALLGIQGGKAAGSYLSATCGLYPPGRVLRRATVEPRKARDLAYLTEVCSQQLRLEADKYTLAVLDAEEGLELDSSRSPIKELLFCGLPTEDIAALQDFLLQNGIYPERMELGTIASLGAAIDYLSFSGIKAPTLLLEFGAEVTHSFILGPGGVETARAVPHGIEAMIPLMHRKLNLKDLESARKLFFSNAFDFSGMGPELLQRLLRELQSAIGFYEVQTGLSVTQVLCTGLPSSLGWIEKAACNGLGIAAVKVELAPWLQARGISLSERALPAASDGRCFGLFSLMLPGLGPLGTHAVPSPTKD